MILQPRMLLLIQLASTLSMTGIIWFVQVVHYPLFLRVGSREFAEYEAQHATSTGWVVGPLMCCELAMSVAFLFPSLRPAGIAQVSAWAGAVLVAILWMSTGFLQVPLHNRLAAGLDVEAVTLLIRTNWIRTVAWTLRSCLVTWWVAKMMQTGA